MFLLYPEGFPEDLVPRPERISSRMRDLIHGPVFDTPERNLERIADYCAEFNFPIEARPTDSPKELEDFQRALRHFIAMFGVRDDLPTRRPGETLTMFTLRLEVAAMRRKLGDLLDPMDSEATVIAMWELAHGYENYRHTVDLEIHGPAPDESPYLPEDLEDLAEHETDPEKARELRALAAEERRKQEADFDEFWEGVQDGRWWPVRQEGESSLDVLRRLHDTLEGVDDLDGILTDYVAGGRAALETAEARCLYQQQAAITSAGAATQARAPRQGV